MISPVLSVVVTCYNLEHYIDASLRSALDQREAGNFEIIVVDDASTDGSVNVIRSTPGVRLIEMPENGGVLLAMLAGVDAAHGDIVCLLDGDDLWGPTKLREIRAAFEADPAAGLVTHDLTFMDENGVSDGRTSRSSNVFAALPESCYEEAVRDGILAHTDYVWLGSALSIRRSSMRWCEFAIWARALPYPRDTYQDWPLAYWCASMPDVAMIYVDQPLLKYRLHHANHSGDARTASKALRNFTRARNTLAAERSIISMKGLGPDYHRLISHRIALLNAQIALYAGHRLLAITRLVRVLPQLSLRPASKEIIRFALGVLIGPERMANFLSGPQVVSFRIKPGIKSH